MGPPPTGGTTAERLLANAAQLFRTKGYAGTTTRELSALLGLQNASLYHHMGSKEDLLYQLCMSTLTDVTAAFEQIIREGGDPMDVFHRLTTRYVEEALENRDKHFTMLVEIRSLSEQRRADVIAHRDRNVAAVGAVIAQCQEAGCLRDDIAAKYLTLGLFNLLNWTIFWFSPDGEFTSRQLGELLWTMFAEGAEAHGDARLSGLVPTSRQTAEDARRAQLIMGAESDRSAR